MLEILYEDNHLLVVNKPAGMLTQPSGTDQESVEALAKAWIKEKYQKTGNVFLEAVHRIDKPVSGVVLFARTSKALSRLQEAMRSKQSVKRYWALVEGEVPANEGILEHNLIHDDFRATVVYSGAPEAKKAKLSYQVLKKEPPLTWVEIQLETGRYHQIRAQFSAIGCPIAGDRKYGSHLPFQPDAIALHHHTLEIKHPVTQEYLIFQAPVPDYWPINY